MAEEHEVFDATIKAVDEATAPMKKIIGTSQILAKLASTIGAHTKGMAAVMQAAFGEAEHGAEHAGHAAHEAGQHIKAAGHEAAHAGHAIAHAANPKPWMALAAHVTLLRGHFGKLNATVGELGHSVTEFLPALAGIGAAGGLVGLFEMTEHASEAFSEMSKAATMAGVSVAQFAQLSFAAKMTDVSVESMGNAMFRLNRTMGDAVVGKNKNALALFHHLHLEMRDAAGHMRGAADILPELAEAFTKTADPTMRARMAMALFGKAGAEMLPLLLAGREELEAFGKEFQKVGFVPDKAGAEGLEKYHRSMIGLSTAVQGFTLEIGTKLAPVLRPVIEMATEWVAANRDWIATGIANKVGELAAWVERLDIRAIVEQTQEWITSAVTLVGHLGGMTAVLGAVALAVGSPLIEAVAGAITVFGTLGNVIKGVGLLMWANPIIVIAAAIAGAGYLIYQNWSLLGEVFSAFWRMVVAAFEAGWAKIEPIVNALKEAMHFAETGWVGRQLGLATAGGEPGVADAQAGAGLDAAGQAFALPPPGARDGRVTTTIIINGLPPGSTVRSSASGIAAHPDVNVGYSNAGFAGAF